MLPIALQPLLHQSIVDGFWPAQSHELEHAPESSHIRVPVQRGGASAAGRANVMGNGTGTYADCTGTRYFWPIP
jgi:hypothetical protein